MADPSAHFLAKEQVLCAEDYDISTGKGLAEPSGHLNLDKFKQSNAYNFFRKLIPQKRKPDLESAFKGASTDIQLIFNCQLMLVSFPCKKEKKVVYTTPKKIKHKRKKVKPAVLKYYEVVENGKIRRLCKECQSPTCGGIFMAAHENRYYCGRCHDTLVVEEPVVSSKGKGGKKK